jgi:hypothetical protein
MHNELASIREVVWLTSTETLDRAAKMTPEERSEAARKAVNASGLRSGGKEKLSLNGQNLRGSCDQVSVWR